MSWKKVEVWLKGTSEPIVHKARNTYTKGPMFCVQDESGCLVHKYPVCNIFRVIEGYGTHGGEGKT